MPGSTRWACALTSSAVWYDSSATPRATAAHTSAPGFAATEEAGENESGGCKKAGWCVTSTFAPIEAASSTASTVGSSATATPSTRRAGSPTVMPGTP